MKYFLIVFSFMGNCALAQLPMLKAGNSKPGFISLTRFDSSRTAVAEQESKTKGRIIQINLWYPSKGNGRPNSFIDYVELVGKELDDSPANKNFREKGIDKYFEWPASAGADKAAFTKFLDDKSPMLAYKNAEPQGKDHPVVLLVHGYAADYAYLAEYLASYGYIVMQVPVKGSSKYELDYEGQGLDTQVKDYEFALSVIRKEFGFTSDDLATVGFSFGGQSAVALALRNKNVKSVVSLDGGIGSFFGAQLISNQSYYTEKNLTAPILHLYNPTDGYTELSWFKSIPYAERYLAAMKNMQHGHFTSFGLLNKIMPGIMGKDVKDPGRGYETVMLLTKEFIRSGFNKDLAPHSFFSKQQSTNPWINDCIESTAVKALGVS